MARMALATGSCPSCGRTVVRTVSLHHGLATEAYHCPMHGRRESSPTGISVEAFASPPGMSTLRDMYSLVAPTVGGLDWVL